MEHDGTPARHGRAGPVVDDDVADLGDAVGTRVAIVVYRRRETGVRKGKSDRAGEGRTRHSHGGAPIRAVPPSLGLFVGMLVTLCTF